MYMDMYNPGRREGQGDGSPGQQWREDFVGIRLNTSSVAFVDRRENADVA